MRLRLSRTFAIAISTAGSSVEVCSLRRVLLPVAGLVSVLPLKPTQTIHILARLDGLVHGRVPARDHEVPTLSVEEVHRLRIHGLEVVVEAREALPIQIVVPEAQSPRAALEVVVLARVALERRQKVTALP